VACAPWHSRCIGQWRRPVLCRWKRRDHSQHGCRQQGITDPAAGLCAMRRTWTQRPGPVQGLGFTVGSSHGQASRCPPPWPTYQLGCWNAGSCFTRAGHAPWDTHAAYVVHTPGVLWETAMYWQPWRCPPSTARGATHPECSAVEADISQPPWDGSRDAGRRQISGVTTRP
jgi:hypothetical protein